ncbi:MAG: hypothetical protein OEZ68_10140 [Gammaproteobacteria bacterium]|nr:hypothetical protein [Gammaproteobacteria bacterium]MDH5801149.1 hypothetical protein [Gammaproteobacteria bacterium]
MEIYIGNIPKGTRPAEVRKLIKDSVKGCIFNKLFDRIRDLGHLDDGIGIEIVPNDKPQDRSKPRYGRLVVSSHRLAQLTLNSLKSAQIRGQSLEVRPFFNRDPENDRRLKLQNRPKTCRRVTERRQ